MDLTNFNRCVICLDEQCGGQKNCKCKTCDKINQCPRILHATIRITNRCTQKCEHCCFESHPQSDIMMSVDMARYISRFLLNNDVCIINVMGGEFFCNPDWYEILDILASVTESVRLVSNSDWVNSEEVKSKLVELINKHPHIHISLSRDKWHTNKNVDKAEEFLKSNNIKCNVATKEETTDMSIVPVGRGALSHYGGYYSIFGVYCLQPQNKYSFLIDEKGLIYKCAFGIWSYAVIKDYVNGGFAKQFKDYNKKFYDRFIPNCAACYRSAKHYNYNNKENNKQTIVDNL